MNEALVSWDESSTFNNFGGEPDVQPDEFGNLIGIALGNSSSTQSIDVTESLKDWYEGNSTNNGWIFRPAGTNSVLFRSSEYNSIPTDRPKLSVTYTTVQPNRTPEKPTLVSPANQATGVSTSPTLNVNVSDPDGNPLTVTYYGREVTSTPGSDFTIVVLPDTQFYSSELNGGTKQMFKDQTQWVVDQRASRNIVFVTHLGDCVEHGDNNGNPIEWNNANEAISLLENPTTTTLTHGIPYGIVVGNHDQSPTGDADGMTTFYNQFFGTARFAGRSYYGGHYSINNDNHYQLFSASGLDFIIIHFEYDTSPEPAVLAWANNLLQTYSNRRAIISTHHIVNQGNPGLFSPQGQEIYDALKGNSNLFLMLGGHTGEEGQRADTFNTNTVYSLLSNYQARTNGGNGWLRSMTFSPANNQIQVETYSPTLNQSETDANSQFNLSYDMTGSGNNFTIIGTNNLVMGPTSDSMVWNGLKNSTKYEWYVEVSDGQVTNTSPVWEFETGSFEGDVAGITGNGAIEPNDVVQMRLFQIGFSSFDPSTNQFQRADSAPIGTFGDGCITPADIVQTRLYQIGFNSLTAAGGPTIENCPTTSLKKNDSGTSKLNKDFGDEVIKRASRSIQVNTTSGNAGKQVQVDLIVDALGDESEYGFRVNFDSKVLTYQNTTAGNVNAGKTLCNQTSPGVLLCSVGLFEDRGDGSNRLIGELVAGKNQILAHLNFSLADKAVSGTTTDLKISNSSAADDSAGNLAVIGKNGTVRITGSRSASVQGKILNQSNKTISGAIVQMTDEDGVINKTRTNSFGYYQFENVTIGEKYIFNIFAKGYRFTPQTVKLTESLTDQHFIVN